jgi:predicted anti-sigma-YlaC factor YlaD
MKHVTRTGFLCERGREWISLRLDGELSELAQKMLDSHLARCPECREFEEQVSAIALQLRAAPLEQLERPVEIVGRRFRVPARVWSLGAAAASVAAAAVGVVGFINIGSSSPLQTGSAPLVVVAQPSGNEDLRNFREMRAAGLKPVVLPPRPSRGPQKT